MARPIDDKLTFFSHDCGLLKDSKFRKPRAEHGILAPYVYTVILEIAYSSKGYYIPYETAKEKEDLHLDILDYLSGRYAYTEQLISEVIECLKAYELFSGDLFHKIITSKRMQKTYYTSTAKRKDISVNKAYWLLTLEEMKKLSIRHSYYLKLINDGNNPDNDGNNSINDGNNPQKKNKNKKKNNNKKRDNNADAFLSQLVSLKPDLIINNHAPQYTLEDYRKAFKIMSDNKWFNDKNNFNFLSTIDNNMEKFQKGGFDKFPNKSSGAVDPSAGMIKRNLTNEQLDSQFQKLSDDEL